MNERENGLPSNIRPSNPEEFRGCAIPEECDRDGVSRREGKVRSGHRVLRDVRRNAPHYKNVEEVMWMTLPSSYLRRAY